VVPGKTGAQQIPAAAGAPFLSLADVGWMRTTAGGRRRSQKTAEESSAFFCGQNVNSIQKFLIPYTPGGKLPRTLLRPLPGNGSRRKPVGLALAG
jgi:hypothetical protein